MNNELLFLSKNDIPFAPAQIAIHQPTIQEIAYIGEEAFYMGCGFLNFSKEKYLSNEDNSHLQNQSNFDILMSIMKDNSAELQHSKINALMVLTLLFPDCQIHITDDAIELVKNDEVHKLNSSNYEQFKQILVEMFCLKTSNGTDELDYNPQGDIAKRIADKLKRGREKAAQSKGEVQKISILSRYISILSVGEQKDMNSLMQYSVYQLFDEHTRFLLREDSDLYLRGKLAGVKDMKEVDNWMKDIHE